MTESALFCRDLLWIISVSRNKRLIGGFSFGSSLIVLLKCISFGDRRA